MISTMLWQLGESAISVAALAADPAATGGDAAHGPAVEQASSMAFLLEAVLQLGLVVLSIGVCLCLYRILRGPHLSDRVLAADTLSLQVIGLVIVLGIWLRTSLFFDLALVIGIIGFASTVAFAQYIGAGAPDAVLPPEQGEVHQGAGQPSQSAEQGGAA